jgi:hypothetical protein
MTIARIAYDNELSFGYTDDEINGKVADRGGHRICRLIDLPFSSSKSGRSWTIASEQGCRRLRKHFPEGLGYTAEPRCWAEG